MLNRKSNIGLLLLLLAGAYAPAHAGMLTFNSGTGFIIGNNGHVLTNNHVVERCSRYTVVSNRSRSDNVQLVAQDKDNDLALLKMDWTGGDTAALASQKQPLRPGDPVVIVGYPGQSWQSGEAVTGQATILDTKGPRGEEKWIEFTDSLAQGNSGGPLLDSAGNVVGVVSAKAKAYSLNAVAAREELIRKFDLAVSLPTLRSFLSSHGVAYREADSGIYLSPDRVSDIARRFVVNIRCQVDH